MVTGKNQLQGRRSGISLSPPKGERKRIMVKPHGRLVQVSSTLAGFTPPAYQGCSLQPAFSPSCDGGRSNLGEDLALRCFQRLFFPHIATRQCPMAGQPEHQWCVIPGPLVLRNGPLKSPAPTVDKDRTVSRRSEPSSRTALIGEQPNPWDLLQPQDAMSRHRGAKPFRRYALLGKISLLSPGYLLSI